MSKVFDETELTWQPVRPEITQGVLGKTLLADGTRVVLTRVVPGGEFQAHHDTYGHLFYVLAGRGTLRLQDQTIELYAGRVVQIAAGEMHAYANDGNQDLMLLSLNLPAQKNLAE